MEATSSSIGTERRTWPSHAGLAFLLTDHFATGRRLAGVAGTVGTITVQIAAHTGALAVDNLRLFEAVGLYGLFWSFVVCVVPWERYGTAWIAFISFASTFLIFLTVRATAVGADATWVYHFFIVLLNSFYFPRRVAFLLLPLTVLFSALPPWLDGNTAGAIQQIVIVAPVYATITLIGTTLIANLIEALYAKVGEEEARGRLEDAERRNRQLEAIQAFIRQLNSLVDLGPIIGTITERTRQVVPHDSCQVFLLEGNRLVLANDHRDGAADGPVTGFRDLAQWVIGQTDTVVIGDASSVFQTSGLVATWSGVGSILAAPLLHDNRPLGAILLGSDRPDAFSAGDVRLLTILAGQTSTAIANARLHQATRRDAETDGLTGLLNHRAIFGRLENAVTWADEDHPVSVMMVDLNTFKRINDTYGHPFGNDVLRGVSTMLRTTCRATDAIGRYGGDEFLAVLPDTAREDAEALARRLDATVAAEPLLPPTGVPIVPRLSIGVASLPEDGVDAAGLIAAADRRLYQAKRAATDSSGRAGRRARPASIDPDADALASVSSEADSTPN